jgi:predicted permease
MLREFRFALRRLAKTPGFSAVTVATLALAIGANTTTFSALNHFLLRPLPVERPKELVSLNTRSGGSTQSYPGYLDFRDRNRSLAGLIAYRIAPVGLNQGTKNAHIWGFEATGNYFDVLGVHAILGRMFTPEDDRRGSPNAVIVISYTSWQTRFASDPAIVGKTAKLNGLDYTIVGVAPKGFFGTELLLAPEFWVPMNMEPQIEPGNPWLDRRGTQNIMVAGRLKPGVTSQQAEADLSAIAADVARAQPKDRYTPDTQIRLAPPGLVGTALRGPVVGFASVLMALAAMVLLIACVNIAGMLLARAAGRRKEVSICLALGASKWTLVRQLLTESFLLTIAGTSAGLLLALWILRLMASFRLPINVPVLTSLPFDWRVALFSIGLSAVTTMMFGLVPAIQAARVDLLPALKNQISDRFGKLQLRDFLVGAQVSLSLVLLVGTVLVVRSLQRAVTIDIGFNPNHAVAVTLDVSLNGYDEARGKAFEHRLMNQLKSLPNIESIALTNYLPLGIGQSNTRVQAEGKEDLARFKPPVAYYYNISPGYLHVMQTRLIAGRDFDERDRQGAPLVAIVNQSLARKLFPAENALGKRVHGPGDAMIQIVGIIQDGKYQSLNDNAEAAIFWPREQRYDSFLTVVARSSLPSADVIRMITGTVNSLDSTLPFFQADSLEDHLRIPLAPARLAAIMLGGFGLLAAVLAATGVYGMLAYAISRRTREIGIRVAIGATRANVLTLVLRRAAFVVGGASVLGTILALTVGRFFAPILYGVSPRDPATYALALSLMAGIGFIACCIPARRALRIEPSVALRDE